MKNKIYIIIIIILCLLASFAIKQCNTYRNDYKALRINYEDSVAYFQAKDQSQVATITAFNGKIKDLKVVNEELYKEIDNLKLKTKNVQSIVKYQTRIEYKNDTTYILDTINNIYTKQFDFSDKWRILKGTIQYNNDTLDLHIENRLFADYTIAFDRNNKLYLKCNNPYIELHEISGYTISKTRQKRFGIGISTGYGFSIRSKELSPYIGVSLNYNLIQF